MNRTRVLVICAAALLVVVAVALVAVLTGSHHNRSGPPTSTTSSTTPSSSNSTPTGSATTTSGAGTGAPGLGSTVLLGAFAGSADKSAAGQIAAVGSLEKATGTDLGIVHVYSSDQKPFTTPVITHFAHSDKTLLLSWNGGDTQQIAAGRLDTQIRQRAQEVKALGVPVLFEYRWEMDRPNLQASSVHSPADYIAAWKRIRSIFATARVSNAQFVWCPLAKGFVDGTAQKYYPGDDQVDWVCADVYPNNIHPAPTFSALTAPFLAWAAAHPKPIVFGEFGISTKYSDRERAAWLGGIPAVVRAHPRIKALVYFNTSTPAYSTALGTSAQVVAAFRALAHL